MKKLLFLLFLIPLFVKAQIETPAILYGKQENRLTIKIAFKFPTRCGTPQGTVFPSKDSTQAAQVYDSCGKKLWIYDPSLNLWSVSGGGDLQITTGLGKRTSDTAIFGGVRTNYIVADTTINPDYEITIIPDMQNNTNTGYFMYSRAQMNWIHDSAAFYNVKAVLQVGDIVNNNTTLQWDTADAQIDLLDPIGIPYLFVPGNHDYGNGFNPATRDATLYNTYMGVSRFASKPFYGGHYSTTNENYWIKFSAGTKKYMAVGLEFLPRDAVVTWAGGIIDSMYAAEPDREVMIVTHAYITAFGERAVDSSVYTGQTYGMSADNDGQELWDKLIKKKRSVRWVFSGHYLIPNDTQSPLTGKIISVNDYGDLVNQIYIDYQDNANGGDGYFMRLKFRPSQGTVRVDVYSPYLKQYDTRLSVPNRDSVSYTLNMPTINISASSGIGGTVSVRDDFRVGGKLKNDRLRKFNILFIGDDHIFRDTSLLRYDYNIPKATLGHGLNVDDIRVLPFGRVDLDTAAYLLSRPNGKHSAAINLIGSFDSTVSNGTSGVFADYYYNHYKHFVGGENPPYFSRQSYFLDSNRTTTLGACGTCPPTGGYYGYSEIFLDNNTTLSTPQPLGHVAYYSRQQIRGGSSTINRSHTTGLDLIGFESNLFVVGNVDTLGSFTAFKDQITTYSQGNAVKNYYSFYTDNGFANHIRSWAFYNANTIQRNFFKGQTLIGDSSVAAAGSNKLYVNGGVKIVDGTQSNGYIFTSDANGNGSWQPNAGGSGEINTASNVGGGLANWDSKVGVDLKFNTFSTSDFNLGSNLISIDYVNGQVASGSVNGFLSSADYTSFAAKQAALTGSQGDIIYFSASNTLANLAKNTSATRYLSNTGTSNNPAWSQIDVTNGITGITPVANGGTGISALGTGIATWWGTPSSANLRAALTDENGTGVALFDAATSPSFTTDIRSPLVIGSTSANGTIVITGNNAAASNTSTNVNTQLKVGNSNATIALQTFNAGNVHVGSPTYNATTAFNVQSLSNTNGQGIRVYYLNNSSYAEYGPAAILNPGGFSIQSSSATTINLSGGLTYIGGSSAPTSTLHVGGSFAKLITTTATSLTLTAAHNVITVTATGQTITLPTAVGIKDRIYVIKLTASGSATIATTSSQTIDGAASYSLSAQYKYVELISDNANWLIIGNN